MSIKKLVSIKNAIINTLDMVGGDKNKEMPVFINWAVQAERRIASVRGLRRRKTVLDITNCVCELPCCIVKLERAILGDHGCECDDLFATTFSPGNGATGNSMDVQGFLIIDLAQNSQIATGIVPYEIQDNKLIFQKSHDGQKITVQFIGYNEDCDGFIEVSENHIDAISAFLQWQYIVRSRFGPNPQKRLPYEDMMEAKSEWNRLCSNARAKDLEMTEPERMEIANMLHDPFAGRSLVDGMSSYPNFLI